MSITELERAALKLPKKQRYVLTKRLAEQWEDFVDLKIALDVLSENKFDYLENVEKRLHAKRHRIKTRRNRKNSG